MASTLRDNRVLAAVYVSCVAAFLLLHLVSEPVVPEIEPVVQEIRFNATKAYEYAAELASRFPYRTTGSEDAFRAFLWISDRLREMGYEVKVQEFEVVLERPRNGRNVYASLKGSVPDAVVVLVNYDMAPTSYQAASDTAGHVGVLLELARSLREVPNRREIVFAFVDSEEWGMQGARHFVERYEGPPIRAVVVAEDLTVGNLTSIYLESMGQFSGYAPLWLRRLCRDVGDRLGVRVEDPSGLWEYVYRAVDISFTDQGPIIAKGIPAIEVSTRGDAPELAREVYHTPKDTMENMRVSSFEAYGRYVYALVKSLDEADRVPPYDDDYLALDGRYVPGPVTYVAPSVLAIPVIVHAASLWERRREVKGAFLELGVYAAAFVVSFSLVSVSPALGLIPRYDTYPPPPRHPYLYSPDPLVFALFLAPPVAAAVMFRQRGRAHPFPVMVALSVAAVASLLYNRFGTVVLLAPILTLWPWIPFVRRRPVRALLLVAGLTTFLMLLIEFGERIFLGPLIAWYLLLGVAYGQFHAVGNLITALVAGVMTYLLRNYVLGLDRERGTRYRSESARMTRAFTRELTASKSAPPITAAQEALLNKSSRSVPIHDEDGCNP
ncbi:MAG: M28 family peptidase [Nitrososphaerota archaeon]|nr:M28 family peptidase [Nitrososphaerota archaeon]